MVQASYRLRLLSGLAFFLLPLVHAASLSTGVTFDQVNFTYPGATQLNSGYGQAFLDYSAIPGSGYVNVKTAAGWVVQNMPVFLGTGLPGLSMMFDLGFSGTQTSDFFAQVEYTPTPLFDQSQITAAAQDFGFLGTVDHNEQGDNPQLTAAPPNPAGPNALAFNPAGQTTIPTINTIAPSVQQDTNQCGPAAVANSLAYLKQRYGVPLAQQNVPGIAGNPPNSLVGQIDNAVPRAAGQGVWRADLLDGKLRYLDRPDGPKGLVIMHQGYFDHADGTTINGNETIGNTTSRSAGATVTIDFLMKEIRNGEDVEMDLNFGGNNIRGPGHEIMITGGGFIFGRPYVTFVHDARQTNDDPNNTRGTGLFDGGYGFAWLDDPGGGGAITFNGYVLGANGLAATVRNVITESVPEPGTFLIAAVALAVLCGRRRAPSGCPLR